MISISADIFMAVPGATASPGGLITMLLRFNVPEHGTMHRHSAMADITMKPDLFMERRLAVQDINPSLKEWGVFGGDGKVRLNWSP
jgi:hypothetical protein